MPSIQETEQIPETPKLKRKSYTIRAQNKYYEKIKNDPVLRAKRNARIYASRKKKDAERKLQKEEQIKEKEINQNLDNIKQLLKEGKITLDELKSLQ